MSIFIMCMAMTLGLGYFIVQSGILSYRIQQLIYKNFDHNMSLCNEMKAMIEGLSKQNDDLKKEITSKIQDFIHEIDDLHGALDMMIDDYMISNQCANCMHKVCSCISDTTQSVPSSEKNP